MFELFTAMFKEEWRVHSTMFGSMSFALFPVLIFGITFMGTFLIPLMRTALPPGNLSISIHASFLMLGFMVGAFGLLGAEVMNRRFGQASLLSYSARSLPLSERFIFANFVIKDTVYYFLLWVLPFCLGFLLASPLNGIPLSVPLLLLLTLTLSFLSGLSLIFFLSTIYSRSKPVLALVLLVFAVGIAGPALYGMNPALLFPPLQLFNSFSTGPFLLSCIVIGFLFAISLYLFSPEQAGSTKHFRAVLAPAAQHLTIFPYPPLAAKDIIDLYRSGSMIGQTLFSFIIPLVVIWFFLSLLSGYLPPHGGFFMFAIVTGVIASTMYTWLTMFDTFGSYACLPVSVRMLLTSKITSFLLLQLIPAIFLIIVAVMAGESVIIIPALVLCLSVSFYTLGVMVWLTGLSPSVLVYDVRVMAVYLVLIGIALTIFSALAFADPLYALGSVLLLVPAWIFIRKGFVRWETREQPGF